ncbi:MAG: hypothetical protein ACRC28_12525 [Clostridium sp.]|uniref:hypothetical protein n=1 Tax=Clostridium sp. TaxID=1506 RepID=UPI003F405C61
MDILFLFEIAFILFNLFFLIRNIVNKRTIKKEGSYHSIYNFNSLFFSSTILCFILILYIIFAENDFTPLTQSLAILIILLLIISNFVNANILFGHDNFSYSYYSISYKKINYVLIKPKGNKKLILFSLNDKRKFSFTTSKNNSSIISEILNRKSVVIKKIKEE